MQSVTQLNPEKPPPDIDIQNLSLNYKHKPLFKQFSLHLPAASWNCLLGASGVGKSTLLKLLAGLPTGVDEVTSGEMITVSDQQTLQGRIAYMAQQDLLLPWLSVLENCLLGFRLRNQLKQNQIKEQALNLLHKVGLRDALSLRVSQLSMGMRQRVALVRTLLENRPIVLMDEPFSALDFMTRLQLQDLAAQLLCGKTVLHVTHDPLEAVRLADSIFIFKSSPIERSEIVKVDLPRPRDPNDFQVLTKHSELLKQLGVRPVSLTF